MTTLSHVEASCPPPAHLASAATRQLLRRYVARRVPAADVEDVVQATLCDALASGRAPGQAEDFRRWVLAIARFKIVDAHRAAARVRAGDGDELVAPAAPVEAIGLIRWAERQLPSGTEATLRWMMREADGDKLEAIAADEGLPPECVRQRVSRLRRWMRGRWLAEMALIAVIAIAARGALRRRHEAIFPEPGLASLSSDASLRGTWRLVAFIPHEPLPAARQALVDRLLPGLAATFDGQTLRASAANDGFERAFAAIARGGQIDAVETTRGTRFAASYSWEGEDLVISIPSGPWAGVARLRPAGSTAPPR